MSLEDLLAYVKNNHSDFRAIPNTPKIDLLKEAASSANH